MYYSDDVIEEVRARNDIVDVISSYVSLKKKGANYFGLCPFHNEKTGSFSVSPSKQIFYCFGCGAGGNVISFIMQYENLSFPEAVRFLASRAGMSLPDQEYSAEEKREHDLKGTLLEINKAAATHFYHLLYTREGAAALSYLRRRGLDDSAIRHFGLGYSSRRPGELYRFLKERGYQDSALKESGLVTIEEKGARDKFWNRAMFPILDVNSRVIGFGGRVLGDGEPKYLNSPETRLFDKSRNLYGLNFAKNSRKDFFLLCEGYMDVITLQLAGFTNAVASLGTALTSRHCLILKRYVRHVVLTYDSDGAGINAAKRAIPLLREVGIDARVLTMKPKKDPDEFIRAYGAEGYQKRIDEAKNAFLWEIDQIAGQHSLEDPAEKTAFYREAAEKLTEFSEPLERDNYVQAVAREHGIPERELRELVNEIGARKAAERPEEERARYAVPKILPNGRTTLSSRGFAAGSWRRFDVPRSPASGRTAPVRAGAEIPNPAKKSECLILSFLAEHPDLLPDIERYLSPEEFTDPLCREIAETLYRGIQAGGITAGALLSRYAEDEEKQKKAAAVFETGFLSGTDPEEQKKAAADCIRRIKLEHLNREAEAAADVGVLQKIFEEKAALRNLKIEFKG